MNIRRQSNVETDEEYYEDEDGYDSDAEIPYSDEMSRQAVGKLFASNGDTASRPLVKGFRDDSAGVAAKAPARPVRQPTAPKPAGMAAPRAAQQPRRAEPQAARRESPTTKITKPDGQAEAYTNELREARAAARMRTSPQQPVRQHSRNTPNVQAAPGARGATGDVTAARQQRQPVAPVSDDLDFDGFRQRYNPKELVSTSRPKNRPVRSGQPAREVKRDRVRISDRDLETINSFRLVIFGSCVGVVLLLGVLVFSLVSVAGERNALRDENETLAQHRTENLVLAEELAELREEVRGLDFERFQLLAVLSAQFSFDGEAFLRGDDPESLTNASAPGQSQLNPDQPGTGTTQWQPIRIPEEGHMYTVVAGDNMAEIVERFWPTDPRDPDRRRIRNELIAHVAATNNISNPEHIQAGWDLLITRHPTILQP